MRASGASRGVSPFGGLEGTRGAQNRNEDSAAKRHMQKARKRKEATVFKIRILEVHLMNCMIVSGMYLCGRSSQNVKRNTFVLWAFFIHLIRGRVAGCLFKHTGGDQSSDQPRVPPPPPSLLQTASSSTPMREDRNSLAKLMMAVDIRMETPAPPFHCGAWIRGFRLMHVL